MHRLALHLLLLLLLVAYSCRPKTQFVPGLTLGRPEAEWRKQIKTLEQDSVIHPEMSLFDTSYRYMWKVGDTVVQTQLRVNDDPITGGALRTFSLDLVTSSVEVIPDQHDVDSFLFRPPFAGRFCSQQTIDKVKRHLKAMCGASDSVAVSGAHYFKDTSYWYSTSDYLVELHHSWLSAPRREVNTPFYTAAEVRVYKKGYAAEMGAYEAAYRKELKPRELVEIGFEPPTVTSQKNNNGAHMPALTIKAWKEAGISTYLEKPVDLIKGDLIIEDHFGEALYTWSDFEYKPVGPVKASAVREIRNGTTWFLFLLNRPELEKLKRAVALQRELKIRYVPTALSFIDGTLMTEHP